MLQGVVKFALLTALVSCAATDQANLTVTTKTGTFVGGLNDTYPDVRHFKYIPYAKPPVGSRRWASPERLENSSEVIQSTVFGPACGQYVTAVPSAWALNITGNLVVNYGESLLAGEVGQNSAEDCLTLAIWTPANATPESNLPVIHFLTGGGDVTGGVNIPTQLPANWVHRSQSHIVVTTNYRVNIFSYPNARGLNGSTNFALQDQRVAVEWVAENIAAFGGDPSKITLWGQSAGSSATDMYLFSFYDDPIVRASISSSGFAIGHSNNEDFTGTNFTFVAKSLGCDFEDAHLELECMRHVPMARMENFIGQYQDNSTLVNTSQPAISFTRQVDNKYVFSDDDYKERYLNGQIAQLPKIIGTTAREASALVPYPINNVSAGPSEDLVVSRTLSTVCAAYNTSILRNEANLSTYRYEWAGNFSNIAPIWWLGAYHYSDLYMFFGTYLIAPGEISDLEVQTSEKMQDYLQDFITDPSSLQSKGWPAYMADNGTTGGTLAQFGADGQVVQFVDGNSVEGACHIAGDVYNTSP
ncbi:Alpha/Beta hydrolase protein [Lentinula detonsa]|uniref:Carboxylic ester hydrolase n=1 Tax=Lentinula detonsa TaxID=2804962 RepID=A0A9W8PCF1_9AGAR|nr:Alpha/Beta hydrolase protein [Lentinula detonsa]